MELPSGLILFLEVLHVLATNGNLEQKQDFATEPDSVLQAAWKEHKERFQALLKEMETKFNELMEGTEVSLKNVVSIRAPHSYYLYYPR